MIIASKCIIEWGGEGGWERLTLQILTLRQSVSGLHWTQTHQAQLQKLQCSVCVFCSTYQPTTILVIIDIIKFTNNLKSVDLHWIKSSKHCKDKIL